MQIRSQNNNVSFSATIPVRVIVDGKEICDPKMIKSASRQLISAINGPVKDKPKELEIAKKLAAHDPDYNFRRALFGYRHPEKWKKSTPSDFFRLIFDRNDKPYLLTGRQAVKMAQLGKAVGNEKFNARIYDNPDSYDLFVAKKNYESFFITCLNDMKLRITEFFDTNTRIKSGRPVTLNVQMISNQKYGKQSFKMNLSDIDFTIT